MCDITSGCCHKCWYFYSSSINVRMGMHISLMTFVYLYFWFVWVHITQTQSGDIKNQSPFFFFRSEYTVHREILRIDYNPTSCLFEEWYQSSVAPMVHWTSQLPWKQVVWVWSYLPQKQVVWDRFLSKVMIFVIHCNTCKGCSNITKQMKQFCGTSASQVSCLCELGSMTNTEECKLHCWKLRLHNVE